MAIFDISACEERIGYCFKDKMLLRQCFTHSSYANEHGEKDNELLEFFGDAVIEFIVTEYLFKKGGKEGELTFKRADIVSKKPLLKAFKELGLNEYLLLGNGQTLSATGSEKLYSSAYEALVAGIYIDGGIKNARKFVLNTVIKNFENVKIKTENDVNYKSKLQEYVQKKKLGSIEYVLLSQSGPSHAPSFSSAVTLNGNPLSKGEGKAKREAEQQAAKGALAILKKKKK
ncbi:MAG: ribonuclease III [Clostridia bacterium]|nr:ribonuclease III [Clostridia bacterium]